MAQKFAVEKLITNAKTAEKATKVFDPTTRKFQALIAELPSAPKEGTLVSLTAVLDRLAAASRRAL